MVVVKNKAKLVFKDEYDQTRPDARTGRYG